MTSRDEIVRTIAFEIERYLAAHPNGADSAEGIRGWWLPPSLRAEPLAIVISALEYLVRRGVLAKTELDGVGVIYSSAVRGGDTVH